MLTLKDLSEYDIKNVDFLKVSKQLLQRKDILVNILIIFISIIIMINIFSQRNHDSENLKKNLAGLEMKVQAIAEFENTKKELKDFVGSLPKGLSRSDTIIDLVNSLAMARNIQISSFTPTGKSQSGIYDSLKLKLSITASSYGDLASFIEAIENSKYNIRLENWSTIDQSSRTRGRVAATNSAEQMIAVDMELTSIIFKEAS